MMAGVIGNMTAKARNKKRLVDLSSDKSVYILDPFDEFGFNPETHNKYVRIRVERGWEARSRWRRAFRKVQILRNKKIRQNKMKATFQWKIFLSELLIIALVMLFLPVCSLVLFAMGNMKYVKLLLYSFYK